MGDYFDQYKERMGIIGNTFSERMDNDAEKIYENYMADRGTKTAVIDLNEYRIAMIHDKENESVEQYIILADIDSALGVGVVFEVDCVYYIIIYQERTRHNRYFKGYARKCTHTLNIKTEFGTYLYSAYVEGVSGINMQRTASEGMIVDEDKATAKIIIQKDENYNYIKPLKTRFFIGEDVYKVTGKNSLQNMGYLNVEKDYINNATDNKALSIANYYVEEELENNYYISATLLDGVVLEKDVEYDIENILDIQIKDYEGNFVSKAYTLDAIATEININVDKITPLIFGNLKLYLTLDNDINSRAVIVLEVLKEDPISYTVTGEDTLVWSESSNYVVAKFVSDSEVPSVWVFTIEEGSSLVDLEIIDDNTCKVTAKEEGEIGIVVLLATSGAEEVRKNIQITSWW